MSSSSPDDSAKGANPLASKRELDNQERDATASSLEASERDDENGNNSNSDPKKKRSKTFTGCYTCRARKIRCDLGRPSCQKCLKSNLDCKGYDINLRWSSPVQFNPRTGNAISSSGVFQSTKQDLVEEGEKKEGNEDPNISLYYRRHIGFVDWESEKKHTPYKYYHDMDTDLSILHNSTSDPKISKSKKTKMLGPFGVFRSEREDGLENGRKDKGKTQTSSTSGDDITSLKRQNLEHEAGMSSTNSIHGSNSNNNIAKLSAEASAANKRQKVASTASSSKASPSSYTVTPLLNPQMPPVAPQDQLWLSNELRDDALLTAAALNGDTQFLDFMSTLSTPNSNVFTPVNFNSYNHNTNQNDFLNLVFHRHNQPQGNTANAGTEAGAANNSNPPHNMSMLLNDQTSLMNHPQQQQPNRRLVRPQSQLRQENLDAESTMEGNNLLSQGALAQQSNVQFPDDVQYSNYSDYYYNNPYKQNEDLEIHLDASPKHNPTNERNTDLVEGEHNNSATTMPPSIMCTVKSVLEPKLGFDLTIPPQSPEEKIKNGNSSIPPGLPSTALQVQPLTRYLLNYYVTQVADLMTVIPLTENPWKSIYFPRALMAIGELSALGHTSDAKNALLNALLAVSAFNLQSKFPKNSSPMKYYLNLGIRLRNQASVFIKKLLNGNNDEGVGSIENCVRNEKYKDVLCAVMSMISVDLVWGTMQDTNYYINWCGKVITTKMINKKKLSSKASILHRIFSSLKLIQDSTCLDIEHIKRDHEMGYDVNGDKFGKVRSLSDIDTNDNKEKGDKNKIDFLLASGNTLGGATKASVSGAASRKTTSPSFLNKKLINTKKTDEHFATDALYGLPNSLILLFSDTVWLLRTKIYHNKKRTLPSTFQDEVNVLGSKLRNWKLDWVLYDGDDEKKFFSPMHEATYHHIMSFYHALIIYFKRLILDMPGKKLQSSVERTLEHLNAIQVLISKGEAVIIPLFWQGFIAGCEAISQELQMGFKKWGADIAQYLGSYWGARQIMLEVWRRKRMNEGRDDWVSVIQDWEMNLMLN